MPHTEPLVPFGLAIIFIVGAFILIPILRGKAEMVSVWNTLLIGIIMFTGLGSIAARYVSTERWEGFGWFEPTPKEVHWYMWANTAFIATLLVSYYLNIPAKKFAQKRFKKWPEATVPVTFFVLGFWFIVFVSATVFAHFTFLGQVTFNLMWVGVPVGCVFSFSLWNRNRRNMMWLAVFLAVFLPSAIYAMIISAGRRLLLSLLLGPVLVVYWTQLRYWKPWRAIGVMAVAAFLIFSGNAIYSKFRWFSVVKKERRTAASVIKHLSQVHKQGDVFSEIFTQRLEFFTECCSHFGFLTQRYIALGALEPIPLNSLRFLITFPIPRSIWPNKPEPVGIVVARDVAHAPTNWGLGIAAQGAYEGGIPALMLYAVLLAFGARCMDEPLKMQPSNPFLLYMHAGALPHVLAIARGDMGSMTKEVGLCIVFTIAVGWACRLIFGVKGSRVTDPAASSRVPYGKYRVLPTPRGNP